MNHESWVNAVAFGPDGNWLATGSFDNTARVWESATGKEVSRVSHGGGVLTVAFSPDGEWLATGSDDDMARVWDANTWEEVARMTHGANVRVVAFSPDGALLATGSRDRTVRVWYLRPQDLIAEACARLTRNLTREEWQDYLPGEPYRKTCPNLPGP